MDHLIPKPIYPLNFNFQDEDSHYIANYLYVELNKTFKDAIKGNIVKTFRDFNDNFIPVIDFPVLKVYPTRENDTGDISPQISTTFIIAYAVAYTQRTKVSSVCRYVSKEIRRLLKNGSLEGKFQLDFSSPIDVEYEDFIAPDNVIYKYATLTVNIYTIDRE